MGKVLFVVDPLPTLNVAKDTSVSFMMAAQRLGHEVYVCGWQDWHFAEGVWQVNATPVEVAAEQSPWYRVQPAECHQGVEWSTIFIRPDPPVDAGYSHGLRALCQLAEQGVNIVNSPDSVLRFNEKTILTYFPHLSPDTHVVTSAEQVRALVESFGDAIIKPLDGCGGFGIFRLTADAGANIEAAVDLIQRCDSPQVMVQRYLPSIETEGDRRVLMVDGEPLPYVLARMPSRSGGRGNLVRGAEGELSPLTAREAEIAAELAPFLRRHGLRFVGLDLIGGYLTEVNFTSPTCVQHIERLSGERFAEDIVARLLAPMQAEEAE